MKRLIVFLEVISLIMLTTLNGLSQNKSSILASFSPSKIEFVVDNLSKIYSQHIDASVNIDAEDWELFYELNITGIPKERILVAQGVNPAEYFYRSFSGRVSLARGGKNKGTTFLPRVNIKYIPSWLDDPGVYSGNIIFSYSHLSGGKRELVNLGSIPIVITIKPIFSITVWSESRGKIRKTQDPINISPNTVTFLVPKPGEWDALEVLHLTVTTNYKKWSIQCKATELVEYEESKKSKRVIPPIPPDRLYIKGGDLSEYTPFPSDSSYITIISRENPDGDFTINFMLKTDESVLAGEYKGSIIFLFQGSEAN